MKKAKFLFAGFVALAVSASAEPTVSDVLVRQMWPWEGRIRVTFALANTGGNYVRCSFVAWHGAERLGELPPAALSGDVYCEDSCGIKTVWIDPSRTDILPQSPINDLRITVTAADAGGALYKIVDLTKSPGEAGQVEFLSEADLAGGGYGPCATNPRPGVTSFAWTGVTNNLAKYADTHLVLRRVRTGTFMMGEALSSEVTLSGYWIGVFPVTKAQAERMAGIAAGANRYVSRDNISYFDLRGTNVVVDGVECVWPEGGHAVAEYSALHAIRVHTGIEFDLATDAQWEYACRAGTDTKYFYNSDSSGDLGQYAVYGGAQFTSVGTRKPNAWGLYDMLGGGWEWVLDMYVSALPSGVDPVGSPTVGAFLVHRIKRGGASASGVANCTSFKRLDDENCAPRAVNYTSFRLVQNDF